LLLVTLLLLLDTTVDAVQEGFLLSATVTAHAVYNDICVLDVVPYDAIATAFHSSAITVLSLEADDTAHTINATIFGVVLVPRPSSTGRPNTVAASAAHLLLLLLGRRRR
jgi:hypothetical protein